jgi:hypothetical protein
MTRQYRIWNAIVGRTKRSIAGADPQLHDFFELGGRLPLLIHAVFLRVNFGSTGLVGQAKHRLNG